MRERPAKSADILTFSLYLCLIAIGWSMLYTVGYNGGYKGGVSDFLMNTSAGKQTLWVGISLIIFFFTQIIDRKFWQTFAYPIYGLALFFLGLVLIAGKEIKGATSWFAFGSFSIQPSELAKFATCLAIAAFLSRININLRSVSTQLTAFGIILFPAALIMLQPDAGSALVFFSFLLLFYREGFPSNYYVLGFSIIGLLILGVMYEETPFKVLLGLVLGCILVLSQNFPNKFYGVIGFAFLALISYFVVGPEWQLLNYVLGINVLIFIGLLTYHWWQGKEKLAYFLFVFIWFSSLIVTLAGIGYNFLKPHQQDRINVWLIPDKCNPQGSAYNLIQSKTAIASGGLYGQGFRQGNMTQLNYVPEQSTDFIFCTVGEEQGFIGSFAIIAFYLLLLWRITVIAERQRSKFVRCYAYAVVGVLFFHFFVNIGMTMGITPIIGIPLPFISKGGSALMGFSLMIGVLLKLDRHRTET